jgi:hypothetical protein
VGTAEATLVAVTVELLTTESVACALAVSVAEAEADSTTTEAEVELVPWRDQYSALEESK